MSTLHLKTATILTIFIVFSIKNMAATELADRSILLYTQCTYITTVKLKLLQKQEPILQAFYAVLLGICILKYHRLYHII